MVSSNGSRPQVADVHPSTLQTWISSGDAVLIDVREDFEHAEERIDGALSHPLSRIDAIKLRDDHPDKRIVFHCRSGKRSLEAAGRFGDDGEQLFHLAGGIEQWKAVGLPVVRSEGAPRLPVLRQMQIAAGALVVIGVLLGLTVSTWLFALSAFVGCGLMFAGITGWCGMAKLLAVMPWNRLPAKATCCT